ncbi:MAG: GNAT family N-acetyltransferase [Oceanospirillum sp.]|nr:GNAT family N-acetyltransferase [Oceanospirillum sp.]
MPPLDLQSATDVMKIRFINQLQDLSIEQWQQLQHDGNPFMRREFLLALELSGAASEKSGWQPMHLVLEDDQGLAGFMPLYLKNHSYGEYVFDWAWADAYERYGLAYYPKLVSAVPYTPSQGQRILLRKGIQPNDCIPLILKEIKKQANQLGASSWHLLFPSEDENQSLENTGTLTRLNCQFHWFNRDNWQDFEQFLGSFSSRKRKNVRQERRKIEQQSLTLQRIPGTEITQVQLDHFYRCYHITYLQRGRRGYLNKAFFQHLLDTMPEQMMLVIAEHHFHANNQHSSMSHNRSHTEANSNQHNPGDNQADSEAIQDTHDEPSESNDMVTRPVAAALFFHDAESLYGRYWGSVVDADCLHFEACYYQGIEFCLEKGLKHFDPGTQGEHKISRGFKPIITCSNHWVAEEGFQDALKQFVLEEAEHTFRYAQEAENLLPFKQV